MPDSTQRSHIRERIERAIAKAEQELPALTTVLQAFKDLLIETALLKDELGTEEAFPLPEPDRDAFRQGVPIADAAMFRFSRAEIKVAAERLGQAILRGFPKIEPAIAAILSAVKDDKIDSEHAAEAVVRNNPAELEKAAAAIPVDLGILKFVVGRFVKPFVERRAERMAQAIQGLDWDRGYCPVCGSWPNLSLLKGPDGQRWLACGLCSHEWRYSRTACPFCENEASGSVEVFFSEERPFERFEACHACQRYVITMDLRNRTEEVAMEVVPLALVYLDFLAQEQGFTPGATADWNPLA